MINIKSFVPAIILCLISITVFSQTGAAGKIKKTKEETIRQEVLRLEELGRQKALSGDARWDDLMAEGAYLIQGDGTILVYSKGRNLSSLPLKSFKLSDLIARVYGETVIVTGLSEVESETTQKQSFSFQMRYLNVWKKFDDGWKIITAERTLVKPYGK